MCISTVILLNLMSTCSHCWLLLIYLQAWDHVLQYYPSTPLPNWTSSTSHSHLHHNPTPIIQSLPCTHTHTHTRTHARTHAHTHTHTKTHILCCIFCEIRVFTTKKLIWKPFNDDTKKLVNNKLVVSHCNLIVQGFWQIWTTKISSDKF